VHDQESEDLMNRVIDPVMSRDELVMMRVKALRSGVWFKALSTVERSMVNLAIRVVVKDVKSSLLARLMAGIFDKLKKATESRFLHMVLEIGLPLARKFSGIAQGWGNKSASQWKDDPGFMRFLTIVSKNAPEAGRSDI
jgi:hypothetical protein